MRRSNLFLAALACATLIGGAAPGFAQTAAPTTATTTPSTANPGKPANTMSMPATPGNSKMPATPGMASLVNINTASASDLDKLPQIGKARSAKIIAGRPYKSTDELVSKKVLSKGVFDKIKTMVTTG